MRPNDGSLPARRMAREQFDRARAAVRSAPFPAKVALIGALILALALGSGVALPVLVTAALVYGPVAVLVGRRSAAASLSVAVWGLSAVTLFAVVANRQPENIPLELLPFAVAAAAHLPALARSFVPCRTAALTLAWALPIGLLVWWAVPGRLALGDVAAWAVAFLVLVWRLAKSWQRARAGARQQERGVGRTAPPPAARAARPPDRGARAGDRQRGETAPTARSGTAGERGHLRSAEPTLPDITVEQAMAELAGMVGLDGVKEQVQQITASVEAARRRALAGYSAEKPMQHLVFLGPPGTGKTSVARVVAKIFYAFGLLETPVVVEAQRSDLVGEYLGSTAIKANELVDSALGGVLFIDEAYSLVNEGDGHGDRFGNEAVTALLKRAEDDRDNLVIILAGYQKQMEDFLASNPGLNSRFALRVTFPTFTAAELLALARSALTQRGETLGEAAWQALQRMLEDVGRRKIADELGNGRFVRSLLEKAGQARDVRVMAETADPSAADLVTLEAEDLDRAYSELTSRFRGYARAPSLDGALAELDQLVGLGPVKRQVREIAAQLQVAKLRDRQGLASQPPARHFVFTGPPGTGKTTVARILGRIFAALGLLVRPEVVEAHRADLVGEHLGSTAIKTSNLIDSAVGGVLFIDEAYSLYNPGYSGGDPYGAEAVSTLLKRAEDDRERLVIVLAGYTSDMDRFLRSNPGLSSRFGVRIAFPSYSPLELRQIAEGMAEQAGDAFEPQAMPVLEEIFAQACAAGNIDERGNGRFARSLFERACASRDVRVSHLGESASAADLTTVSAADLRAASRELGGEAASRPAR